MPRILDGTPGSGGIARGPVHLLQWEIPAVPHRVVPEEEVSDEVEVFHAAREWTRQRILEVQQKTEDRIGRVEAQIFEPQFLILEDHEVVEGTVRYIKDLRLCAARAFEWRMLELQAMWRRTANPMVLDKLSDLEDVHIRLLHRLLGLPDPSNLANLDHPVILVTRDLTPSLMVQMDPRMVLGIAADQGTRTSHWAILARSMSIPAVMGLGEVTRSARQGQEAIIDGRMGRVILDPRDRDIQVFESRQSELASMEEEIAVLAGLDSETADGQPVVLRANLDLPAECEAARLHGAEGVGLFRTEFLVMGRNTLPDEEEQYQAYRQVIEAFPNRSAVIRTFDLGGDKFPMFLHMPPEENPFLGWRAIRVCLDQPDLFRTQLRALLRATAHGDIRIMLPMVNDVEEIQQVRDLLEQEEEKLRREGIPYNSGYKLGILVETPAAALDAAELARHCDFFSIGTNDLVQYTLAVDRTNARLARLYNPFHPSVLHQLRKVSRSAHAAGLEVSVCGEMATNPLGTFLLLGLDITALSVAWPNLPEVKQVIRSVRMDEARNAAREALSASTTQDVMRALVSGIRDRVDLSAFSGRWNLSLTG